MSVIAPEQSKTLENLLAAYDGECNTAAKYAAFAAKADEEGWHGAASLFRATSRAEQFHAANHRRAIFVLGGEARCTSHPVDVESTFENLIAALAGETYGIETMYPAFLVEAQKSHNALAAQSMTYALDAERTHQRLYAAAVALVEGGSRTAWVGTATDFYVCPSCGYVSETVEGQSECPVCAISWDGFEVIR